MLKSVFIVIGFAALIAFGAVVFNNYQAKPTEIVERLDSFELKLRQSGIFNDFHRGSRESVEGYVKEQLKLARERVADFNVHEKLKCTYLTVRYECFSAVNGEKIRYQYQKNIQKNPNVS